MRASASAGLSERSPFPESLCHACAAPPRYVTSDRGSVFIYCPKLGRYPPQPVRTCEAFEPRPAGERAGPARKPG